MRSHSINMWHLLSKSDPEVDGWSAVEVEAVLLSAIGADKSTAPECEVEEWAAVREFELDEAGRNNSALLDVGSFSIPFHLSFFLVVTWKTFRFKPHQAQAQSFFNWSNTSHNWNVVCASLP